ncbi:molybdopterin molybdotransferase MoeA [Aquabacterium sp. A7-Y]|uniref:molybdopterin molybdotransferase MoeA n=1 Tax=Aquabacterium sp. A7-Y TaxID=1349605 RepID=UPI00223CC6C8|nr:gephyrin-like molybdotransferase Glp [Aquabacterium sp. A7-Y]MCW7540377.1 molybdopterin molybdotransferase MoeA [Aquabacterium sp. A7-Y]
MSAAARPAPGGLTVAEARERIAAALPRVQETERVALRQALGRVLAADVISPIDVPAHDNSAMDGYALRGAELPATGQAVLPVAGQALAGRPFDGMPPAGAAVRIMTGAPMPAGLDTVVPLEQVQVLDAGTPGERVQIAAGSVRPRDHCRLHGEDLARGQCALPAGQRLKPADLGLLASLGQAEVAVWRRLRVALFSTGDELRDAGEPLEEGCIHDSNRYALLGLLERLGVEVLDLGIVPDRPAALEATFLEAAARSDVILTSGGVSAGDADHTRALMARLGQVDFLSLAMRPGRPLAFGRLAGAGREVLLFGLPGNPVASMVAFLVFVRDALLVMSGAAAPQRTMLRARAAQPIPKRAGRTEYPRGLLGLDRGEPMVHLTGAQGSGILSSMSQADVLIVLEHERGPVAAGDWVPVLPFDGLL